VLVTYSFLAFLLNHYMNANYIYINHTHSEVVSCFQKAPFMFQSNSSSAVLWVRLSEYPFTMYYSKMSVKIKSHLLVYFPHVVVCVFKNDGRSFKAVKMNHKSKKCQYFSPRQVQLNENSSNLFQMLMIYFISSRFTRDLNQL
jgi:hypothetical protein